MQCSFLFCILPHYTAKFFIHELFQGTCHIRYEVFFRENKTIFIRAHNIPRSHRTCDNHRQARSHGLQHNHPEGIQTRRKDKQVTRHEIFFHFPGNSGKENLVADPQVRRHLTVGFLIPFSHNKELQPGVFRPAFRKDRYPLQNPVQPLHLKIHSHKKQNQIALFESVGTEDLRPTRFSVHGKKALCGYPRMDHPHS